MGYIPRPRRSIDWSESFIPEEDDEFRRLGAACAPATADVGIERFDLPYPPIANISIRGNRDEVASVRSSE
jgi:hypothetical protein